MACCGGETERDPADASVEPVSDVSVIEGVTDHEAAEEQEEEALIKTTSRPQHPAQADAPPRSWFVVFLATLSISLLCGTAMAKSHAWEPLIIREMFQWRNSVVAKFLLSATGSSALCLTLVAMATPTSQQRFVLAREADTAITQSRSSLAVACGGLLLGAGMAISGSSPEFLAAQIGAGVPHSLWTLAGALVGAVLYGLLEPVLNPCLLMLECGKCTALGVWQMSYLDTWVIYCPDLLKRPFWVISCLLGLTCLVSACFWEAFTLWEEELPPRLNGRVDESINVVTCTLFIDCPAWAPTACGVLMGPLQIVSVLCLDGFLGVTDAYQIVASWTTVAPSILCCREGAVERFSYAASYLRPAMHSSFQIPLLLITGLITLMWETITEGEGKTQEVISVVAAFSGGLMMIFGSRMCGGGVTYHVMSGPGILLVYSFVIIPCILLGGVVAAGLWGAVNSGYAPSAVNTQVPV